MRAGGAYRNPLVRRYPKDRGRSSFRQPSHWRSSCQTLRRPRVREIDPSRSELIWGIPVGMYSPCGYGVSRAVSDYEREWDVRGTRSWYKKSTDKSNFEVFQGELAIRGSGARFSNVILAFPTAPSPTTTPVWIGKWQASCQRNVRTGGKRGGRG